MVNANLSLVRADDQDLGLSLMTSSGTPYNLSGCVFTFMARSTTYFSSVLFAKTGSQHLSAIDGLSQISFVPGDTAGINDLPHYYDIRMTNAEAKITTLACGTLNVVPR